ncbi:MAG: penicillin-binding transpeptidase domain-containing protein [Nocardioidaceae bacterium]
MSALEMAEAYATFAARGMHCASTPVTEISDRHGEVIPIEVSQCNRVLKRPYADAINDILKGVMQPPDGFGAEIAPNQQSAGKTGTTSNNRAVWFVGYTPTIAVASFLAGVNKQNEPRGLIGKGLAGTTLTDASGSGTAGPMWGDAVAAIQKMLPNRRFVPRTRP